MKENIDILISTDAVSKRVEELAEKISADYADNELFLVCVLKGSVVFMVDLAKKLRCPVSMNFMSVSSYGNSTTSGKLRINMDLSESIEGKDVLVIEDIVDTGRTLKMLKEMLESRNPKSLKICALLDKPERRVVEIKADYSGFSIPDAFVVGYGLDYDQRYRNLDYIGVISFEE